MLELGQLICRTAPLQTVSRSQTVKSLGPDLACSLQEVQVVSLGKTGCLVASEGLGHVRLRFLPPHICVGRRVGWVTGPTGGDCAKHVHGP